MSDQITKTERTELKSVVRQQFKVLRAEVVQRQAEVMADVEQQITERFTDVDKAWAEAGRVSLEATLEANRKVNDTYRELTGETHIEDMYVFLRGPTQPSRQRQRLRQQATANLTAQVEGALLRLARQEADLLKTLAVGALESSDAHTFLLDIPMVGELVPTARLAELEASLDPIEDERR